MMMMEMQQQQQQMQQQMTLLMSQFLPETARTTPTAGKPTRAKIVRPSIDADCSDKRWVIFRDAWTRYKEMAKITLPNDIRNELRSTCTQKVNEMLFNFVGPDAFNTANEDDLLTYMKSVAVKVAHPVVYRQQFFVLKQNYGESITSFISRLKAQAMLCAFVRNGSCHNPACKTSYSEDMIRSHLIADIRSSAYQSKVLSEITILQTLEQLTTRLLALEASERASSQFRSPFDTINESEVTPI